MVGMVMLIVLVLGTGGIVWMRRRRRQAYATSISPGGMPRETLALQAFAQGNSYLAAGQFDEAITAFHQAREFEPKHPHVAGRLAEVERRQHAASATPPVNAPV